MSALPPKADICGAAKIQLFNHLGGADAVASTIRGIGWLNEPAPPLVQAQ
jgi:hypothetical protein